MMGYNKVKTFSDIQRDKDDALEILLEVMQQACGTFDKETETYSYDSMTLSSYENALEFLVEHKQIKASEVSR